MRKVIIKIKGTQGLGEQKDVIEFTTEGTLRKADGDFILSYFDGAILETQNVRTRLIASGDKSVTLERTGAVKSKLYIEKGVRNSCFYSVPEGSLTLGIYGKEIENTLSENGGKIKMVYTLDTDLKLISENSVEVTVEGR